MEMPPSTLMLLPSRSSTCPPDPQTPRPPDPDHTPSERWLDATRQALRRVRRIQEGLLSTCLSVFIVIGNSPRFASPLRLRCAASIGGAPPGRARRGH
eukprot:1195930-Prorocentrum_minimum.AAC.2